MSDETLKKTALYDAHLEAGAKMVPFAGFEMPVSYAGVIEEHRAVREAVGLFDVSHMGEVQIRGPKALDVANRIFTNDITRIADGQAMYTMMCKEDGGIVDDLIVYRVSPEHVLVCVNAANRDKDFQWMKAQAGADCEVADESDDWVQIAVQGPNGVELVSRLAEDDVQAVKPFRFIQGDVAGRRAMIARTGYTGEDGFELYCAASDGPALWAALLEGGADLGVRPAGLGARDSLRLEVCLALYGNDIDETTNPIEAGLGWTVKLNKDADFVGKAALERVKAEGPKRKLVAFEVTGRGIARAGYGVLVNGAKAGHVTSGTKGPTVGKAIGMAYVPTDHAAEGTAIQVEIRDKPVDAVVVKKPFLRRG